MSGARRTAAEVAKYLRDFIEGVGGEWDWDDFESVPIANKVLDDIRRRAANAGPPDPDIQQLRRLLAEAEALAARPDIGDEWTIRPARSAQILMGCLGAPFLVFALSVGGFLAMSGDLETSAYAVVPFLIGCWCLLEISTLRLHLSADRLWLSRWWHIRWSVQRGQAELRSARVGDVPSLRGLHVIERSSGRKVGEIISGQFPPEDLAKLTTLLAQGEPVRST